ncbi:MAG: HNH endonuclease signature motif containing protein [Dyella sp.]|uniref:HNH endonuclease signature motif containing protein n=1 Tax=Dyella sp. TaxID=1869338 RepID=UPI003F81F19A
MTKSRGILKRIAWSEQDVAELVRRYPHEQTKVIAADLGRPIHTVYQKANGMGLKKDAAYLASEVSGRLNGRDTRGLSSRFKKGLVPANKGLKRPPGWAPGRMAKTQFKKGKPTEAARNYQPIGTERISKDGYLERKVTDDHPVPARRWVAVHRLVWEAANGPIPAGHAVVFRKGMRTALPNEITKERLELVTRAELMRRNTIHRYPAELKQTIRLVGRLRRAIEDKADEKQD